MTKLYTPVDHNLVLGMEDRAYILKIRDLPVEEKPREKLIKYGPEALSTSELLAVLLNTGTKKEDVLAMSARILKEYGERSFISQKDAERFARDLNIPVGKSAQIIACAEIGRRFFQKRRNGTVVIRTARDVFEYAKELRELTKEHLRGIYLDAHHRVIHDEVISIGTVNANIVHPREVFKPALEHSAVAVVLVHNHPSGLTKPSAADIAVTRQLVETGKVLGISLLDHVIVTKTKFASIPVSYE